MGGNPKLHPKKLPHLTTFYQSLKIFPKLCNNYNIYNSTIIRFLVTL